MEAHKSSNEILTELFGTLNAEPPQLDLEPSKKSKKQKHTKKKKKSKKSKKKHHSKSKKHSKRSKVQKSEESSSDSDENTENSFLNIEVPANKVLETVEILLDGTVGIKGDNGQLVQIIGEKNNEGSVNNNKDKECNEVVTSENLTNNHEEKTNNTEVRDENLEIAFDEKITKKDIESGEKKGKIQIKNLKFSSVFQEIEEEQKKEEEERAKKAANHEEGEISDSSKSSLSSFSSTSFKDKESKSSHQSSKYKYSRHSSDSHRKDLRSVIKDKQRSKHNSSHKSRHRHESSDKYRSRSPHRRDRHSSDYDKYYSDHSKKRKRSVSKDGHDSRSHSSHRRKEERRSGSKDVKRSRSKDEDSDRKIDKKKLLAIARKNALKLIDAGVIPSATADKVTSIKAGGKTVDELTKYCELISKKEALGEDVSDIDSNSDDDEEKPFHHPFTVRDRPNSIVMNIRNATPLPVKSLQEKAAEQSKQLRLQFPVSSGSSHRRNESEWVAVSPVKDDPPPPAPPPAAAKKSAATATAVTPAKPAAFWSVDERCMEEPQMMFAPLSSVPPPEPVHKPVFPVIQPSLPDPPAPPPPDTTKDVDISSIVSQRLEAMRRLQENPNDVQAISQMYKVQKQMKVWAESKQETGAFTGTTGAKVLSVSELSSGSQAWAKKDQLSSATPVKGGMGMALLQKMGWQPGEGLGKNKEGTLEPLRLEIKMDKKGLLAAGECRNVTKKSSGFIPPGPPLPTVKTLDGKHPVSLLNEFCNKRKWGVPQFELCFECGPDHKKNFLFKVKVNGIEYQPNVASTNKKQAKAEAAAICLKSLGVISNETS